ncbi:MAG: YjbQ family protein, partial [Acetobacteraceae bacterium]|nr:YjbQ family protein [Acetobacteraceae bacterium]
MRQALHRIEVRTSGKGLVPITGKVVDWVGHQGMQAGLLTLWCRHTSASLTVQENADPAVREDIAAFFE